MNTQRRQRGWVWFIVFAALAAAGTASVFACARFGPADDTAAFVLPEDVELDDAESCPVDLAVGDTAVCAVPRPPLVSRTAAAPRATSFSSIHFFCMLTRSPPGAA